MTDTAHHEFSPSRLGLFALCPGAYKMQMGMPDRPSPEAERGTRMHAATASGDTSGLSADDASIVEAARAWLEELRPDGYRVLVEEPMEALDEYAGCLTHGTCDVLMLGEQDDIGQYHRAILVDLKYGRVPVPPPSRNYQLAAYALAAMDEYGVDEVETWIYQPLCGAPASHTFCDAGALRANIALIIGRCKQDTLICKPGEHCQYCRAAGRCPAAASTMGVALREETLPDVPDSVLLDLYRRSKVARKICDRIEEAVKARIERDGACGGLRFKEVSGRREVKDIAAAWRIAAAEYGMPLDAFLSCVTLSTTKLIDAAVALSDITLGQAAAKREAEDAFSPVITRGEPTRRIVEEAEA